MSRHVARPTYAHDIRHSEQMGQWMGRLRRDHDVDHRPVVDDVGTRRHGNDEFFVATQDYLFKFDASTWGWGHLVLGVGIAAAGLALPAGAAWARFTGIVMASLALVAAFAWMLWYPIWGIVFMVASAMSTWALTVPGEYLTADF